MTTTPEIFQKLDTAYANVATLAKSQIRSIQLLLKPEYLLIRVMNGNTLKLLNLFVMMGENGPIADLPYREMAETLDVSLRTITRAIADLKSCNIIKVTGKRHSLIYTINDSNQWTGIFEEQRQKIDLLKESGKFTVLSNLNDGGKE